MPMTVAPAIDLDLLDLDARQASVLSRRALYGLFGLLALVAVSIVLLALFLQEVESDEEARRLTADAEWLDQSLRFHFRRLEDDLAVLAAQAQRDQARLGLPPRSGALWRGDGVIAAQGWLSARAQSDVAAWPAFLQAASRQPEQAGALAVMLDTARGLQRPAYAGPLADTGSEAQRLWLAVPLFAQGRFLGSYVVAIELERALEQAIPAWFLKDHAVLAQPEASEAVRPGRFVVPINLPGAQLKLAVRVLDTRPPPAPRAFFGLALLFLLGMAGALYFLWRDAARRRHLEQQLQAQIALRTAMERSVTLGLRAWSLDGRLLHVNQAFCRMVGWSAEELLARASDPPYWPPEQGDELQRVSRCGSESPQSGLGAELQLLHRDGHRIDVLVHAAPLVQASGAVIGWMGSALDITERKRIERLAAQQQERLEASARLIAVGEVASTLAHELNQPLGALSSFATGLLNRVQAGRITLEEVVPVVERMERMADKAGRVIQRVNAFARRQEMTRQPLELAPLLRRVVGQLVAPDGVALRLDLPESVPSLPADALLLEHAVHNVVLNAIEWAARGGRLPGEVRVSLVPGAGMTGIRVEDSGPGVPAEQQGRIFEAFASAKEGGMGMGLSICRSIIEAHHGRIELGRSAALHGAQFTLWLPLES